MEPTIYIASDHAGFELKNKLVLFLRDELGHEVVDCGADTYDEEDDFTDFISKAAREVSADPVGAQAIILGGSGQGEAMLANRFHDVRAVVYYGGNEEIITLSRKHNNANVLSLGARFVDVEEAKKAVALWLSTPHEKVEKYDRRIEEIEVFSQGSPVQVKVVNERPSLSIVPSLPAESFAELSKIAHLLAGISSGFQVDIVDGVFAPATSWPFTEPSVQIALEQLRGLSDSFEIEMDCMCMEPEQYLGQFVELGVKRVVIHVGSSDAYAECIAHAKDHGYKMGFAVTNDSPSEVLNQYADQLHFIQVMGIKNIGMQGQEFDERTFDTVASLRKSYPHLPIAVDGGVNAETIRRLLQAGATRFAPGSAITQSPDPALSYKQLAGMIGL
jgi:ribose 5-phosphate isomerase B